MLLQWHKRNFKRYDLKIILWKFSKALMNFFVSEKGTLKQHRIETQIKNKPLNLALIYALMKKFSFIHGKK